MGPGDAFKVSDNGLSLGWCQTIVWIDTDVLSIGSLETNFREIWRVYKIFYDRKLIWKCLQSGGHLVNVLIVASRGPFC